MTEQLYFEFNVQGCSKVVALESHTADEGRSVWAIFYYPLYLVHS